MIRATIWWIIKIVCGLFTGVGLILAVSGLAFLVALLAGWVQPGLDVPPMSGAATMLIVGSIQTFVGLKAPVWLDIDRLL